MQLTWNFVGRAAARALLLFSLGVAALGTTGLARADRHGADGSPGPGGHRDVRAQVPAPPKVYTLQPSTHGNPEGIAFDPRSDAFYVGTVGDGTIYRGTLDDPVATVFIEGRAGDQAAGMKVARGLLYVAGGASGRLKVYELQSRRLVASIDTGPGGFLNDLVVLRNGDVWITDSFRPLLWHVTADQVTAGVGTARSVPMGPEVSYVSGAFNLNGIVSRRNDTEFVIGHFVTGQLFRIRPDAKAPQGRTIDLINVEPLVNADGLLLDGNRLVVVQGDPAQVVEVALDRESASGKVVERRTDPTFRGPSTIAAARERFLVVNADFASGGTPFTVTGLARDPCEACAEEAPVAHAARGSRGRE